MSTGRLRLAALLCLGLASAPEASAANWRDAFVAPQLPTQLTLGVGFDFNRGDYETNETSDTASITPLLRLESDNVVLRASLPLFRLEGPIEAGFDPPDETEYGVGDLTVGLAYTVYPLFENTPFFDLTCRVKVPTANADFGTGKADVTLLVSALQSVTSKLSVFADFGVRLRGGNLYHDTLLASLGSGVQWQNGIGTWIAYDWRESPLDGRGDEHELTPFLSIPFGEHLRIDPYALIGLAKASPDWGVGTVLSWKF